MKNIKGSLTLRYLCASSWTRLNAAHQRLAFNIEQVTSQSDQQDGKLGPYSCLICQADRRSVDGERRSRKGPKNHFGLLVGFINSRSGGARSVGVTLVVTKVSPSPQSTALTLRSAQHARGTSCSGAANPWHSSFKVVAPIPDLHDEVPYHQGLSCCVLRPSDSLLRLVTRPAPFQSWEGVEKRGRTG